jgi:hypothetical protein
MKFLFLHMMSLASRSFITAEQVPALRGKQPGGKRQHRFLESKELPGNFYVKKMEHVPNTDGMGIYPTTIAAICFDNNTCFDIEGGPKNWNADIVNLSGKASVTILAG